MKTILVGGTHANDSDPWFLPDSRFATAAKHNRIDISCGRGEGFIWSSQLEVWRFKKDMGTDAWVAAAHSLLSYIDAYCEGQANIIAHSHGGNVACIAAKWDNSCRINKLVTLGTPVRKTMSSTYSSAVVNTAAWRHIYSTSDWWQMFGTFGTFNPWKTRIMASADENILAKGKGHTDLHDPRLWSDKEWWNLVK